MTNVNGKSDIIPTESETRRTFGNFSHGSRETPATSSSPMELDRSEKARCQHPDMHVAGESDSSKVPEKLANNGGVPSPAELVEGRGLTKETTEQSLLDRTQSRTSDGKPFVPMSCGLLGIREAAQKDKNLKFTSLFHHITPELLRSSFFDLKKQAAPGVDGQTWNDYAVDLEQRIKCLAALRERMTKFGLELHPDKTRLIEFGRYAEDRRIKRGDGPPETFDFLGFTHISGKTRRGDFTIHRKTSRKKFQAQLTALKEQLFRKRHDDLAEVGAWLQSVFRGWCQ